jgi:hypothetical protein
MHKSGVGGREQYILKRFQQILPHIASAAGHKVQSLIISNSCACRQLSTYKMVSLCLIHLPPPPPPFSPGDSPTQTFHPSNTWTQDCSLLAIQSTIRGPCCGTYGRQPWILVDPVPYQDVIYMLMVYFLDEMSLESELSCVKESARSEHLGWTVSRTE